MVLSTFSQLFTPSSSSELPPDPASYYREPATGGWSCHRPWRSKRPAPQVSTAPPPPASQHPPARSSWWASPLHSQAPRAGELNAPRSLGGVPRASGAWHPVASPPSPPHLSVSSGPSVSRLHCTDLPSLFTPHSGCNITPSAVHAYEVCRRVHLSAPATGHDTGHSQPPGMPPLLTMVPTRWCRLLEILPSMESHRITSGCLALGSTHAWREGGGPTGQPRQALHHRPCSPPQPYLWLWPSMDLTFQPCRIHTSLLSCTDCPFRSFALPGRAAALFSEI